MHVERILGRHVSLSDAGNVDLRERHVETAQRVVDALFGHGCWRAEQTLAERVESVESGIDLTLGRVDGLPGCFTAEVGRPREGNRRNEVAGTVDDAPTRVAPGIDHRAHCRPPVASRLLGRFREGSGDRSAGLIETLLDGAG